MTKKGKDVKIFLVGKPKLPTRKAVKFMQNCRVIRVIINTKDYKHLESEMHYTFDGYKVYKAHDKILLADGYLFEDYINDLKEAYNL